MKEKKKGPVPIVSQVRHWNLYSFTQFRFFSDTAEKNNDKFPTKVFHVNYVRIWKHGRLSGHD